MRIVPGWGQRNDSGPLRSERWSDGVLVQGVVAQHGPEDVEAASGKGEDCLFVVLSFCAFSLVVGAALGAVSCRGLGGEVEGVEELSVVAFGAVEVAADTS